VPVYREKPFRIVQQSLFAKGQIAVSLLLIRQEKMIVQIEKFYPLVD
jgi:hypothetical protein